MKTPSASDGRSRSLRLPWEALTADTGFWEAARLQRVADFPDAPLEPASRTALEQVARPNPLGCRWAVRRLRAWLAAALP